MMSEPSRPPGDGRRAPRRAVTPFLRKLLLLVLVLTVLLGATGVYQASVRLLEYVTGNLVQSFFTFAVILLHLALGLLLLVPFGWFAVAHLRAAIRSRNRRAVRAGFGLLVTGTLTLVSGCVLLVRNLGEPWTAIAYWTHVLAPIAALVYYIIHRRYGSVVNWRRGWRWGFATLALVALMVPLHTLDPRPRAEFPPADEAISFAPSLARTASGGPIPQKALLMDAYCERCHPDTYDDWFHSAHRLSSFNNPVYAFSVRETRRVVKERDGNVHASRWCAGCHDPVPLFSGVFDDPEFDETSEAAQAGITCTVCHAIVNVNSVRGNADYTIEEPIHYPFTYSEHPFLQWINERLVKAKPRFHKQTFLKPLHKTAEFCSTCHKVHLPEPVTKYKEFLRGQNHYDSYLLSGVSGHGARSFYYPATASPNCAEGCHMPLVDSRDFGNQSGKIHSHLFPGGNTGLPELLGLETARKAQADFLRDDQVRIDIFGVRRGATISGELLAPIRPERPALRPGEDVLLEVVLRTLRVGHLFTQGTTDSNQLWIEIDVRDGARTVGRSGAIDERGFVDPWSHFVNTLMLDRHGRRIDRRNAQDIFVPLYSHQIPPGAGQTVHYRLHVPEDAGERLDITARLWYRKFDRTLMEHIHGKEAAPNLQPVLLAEDRVALPVAGEEDESPPPPTEETASPIPAWQRWNDYGIGLLIKGSGGAEKGELRQAEAVFKKVVELGRADGWVNLARVYEKEGRVDDAVSALQQAVDHPEPAPAWTAAWLSGRVNHQNGYLDAAIRDYEQVLATRVPERGFDFSRDYIVRSDLGLALFDRSKRARGELRAAYLTRARDTFRAVLDEDPENTVAHHNLHLIARLLGNAAEAEHHRRLHDRYRPDDNAADRAISIYRRDHPPANHAAQSIVIYDLEPRR